MMLPIFEKATGLPGTVIHSQKTLTTSHKNQRVCYDDVVPGAYLTAQEAGCIAVLLQYGSYAKVAEILGISTRTVETHLTHIRRKFRCRNKCEVIHLFHRIGIKRIASMKTSAETDQTK